MVGIDQPKMRDTPGAEFREAVPTISATRSSVVPARRHRSLDKYQRPFARAQWRRRVTARRDHRAAQLYVRVRTFQSLARLSHPSRTPAQACRIGREILRRRHRQSSIVIFGPFGPAVASNRARVARAKSRNIGESCHATGSPLSPPMRIAGSSGSSPR